MTHYLFPSDEEGWSSADFNWSNSDGSPGIGCLAGNVSDDGLTEITGLSIPIQTGQPFSCRAKVMNDAGDGDPGTLHATLEIKYAGGAASFEVVSEDIIINDETPMNTGWFIMNGTALSDETIETIQFTVSGTSGIIFTAFLDSVYVAEADAMGATQYWGHGNLVNTQVVST